MLIGELKDIANKHGLRFIDNSARSSGFELNPSFVVAHSYGVGRQQSASTISSYIDAGNPYAHIYINTGKFKYLMLCSDVHKRAIHVGRMNGQCIGIEMNEIGNGSYEISDKTVKVFNDVVRALEKEFNRKLPIISHRYCTGKDCPRGYTKFKEMTEELELGPYCL